MRITKSHSLYSNNMPVHDTAHSFINKAARAGLFPIGFITSTLYTNQKTIHPFPYQPFIKIQVE
jgi:hypothetical protein